jgi:hypothetical protein
VIEELILVFKLISLRIEGFYGFNEKVYEFITAAFNVSIIIRSGEGTKLFIRLYVDVNKSFASLNYLINDSSKTVVYEILSNELIVLVNNAEI